MVTASMQEKHNKQTERKNTHMYVWEFAHTHTHTHTFVYMQIHQYVNTVCISAPMVELTNLSKVSTAPSSGTIMKSFSPLSLSHWKKLYCKTHSLLIVLQLDIYNYMAAFISSL